MYAGSVIMGCGNHFVLHDNFCYRYFGLDVRKPYHSAQKLCSRYHSSLVSLHNPQEETFVVGLAVNQSGFWIGLNDEDGPGQLHKEGHFKWSFGEEEFAEALSYCRWKSGEPDNKQHLDCVKVDVEGWAMAPGGCAVSRLPFVCKKKACPIGEEWDGAACARLQAARQEEEEVVCSTVGYVLLAGVCCSVLILLLCWFGTCHAHYRTKEIPTELFPT